MTMCTSTECPVREECYRADFDSDDRQDYFNYEYSCNDNSGFSDFVPAKWCRAKSKNCDSPSCRYTSSLKKEDYT